MFKCPSLQEARIRASQQFDLTLNECDDDKDKLKNLLNKTNIKKCGKYVEALYRARQIPGDQNN